MYGEFDGEWRAIFEAKPYQGQDPKKAKVLFVGRDANYPDALYDHTFFERVKEYHRDGVAFWEKHEVHHPFLCEDFPFPKGRGGHRYHNNFKKLGLNPTYAQYISFIELREIPTRGVTGSISKSVFISSLTLSHMQRLDRWISQSGRKLVLLPKTIKEDMLEFRNREGNQNIFGFLSIDSSAHMCDKSSLPVIYAVNDVLILQSYSFSSTKILGITSKIKAAIDRFLFDKRTPLMETGETCASAGEKKVANGEFDIFCKSVVGETGWFPRKKTSVMLMDFDLVSGVGRCKINRPTGEDPRLFPLKRDEVNSGIRACRDQRRLLNSGELIAAGTRGFAVAPLYGLLKLYFDKVGFLDNPRF